jgi:hypothetical protein
LALFGDRVDCDIASLNEVCSDDSCSPALRSSKERYQDLKVSLEKIKASCGDICDTTKAGVPGKYFDYTEKNVDCEAIFSNNLIDRPSEFDSPPMRIPKQLMPEFTYQGRVEYRYNFYDDSKGSTHLLTWTKDLVDIITNLFREGTLRGPYGIETVNDIYRHLTSEVRRCCHIALKICQM